MSNASLGPGDDVEAWCTRCRMNLYHRIIATVGNSIKTVHCLTCGGDHKYHPPKNKKAPENDLPQQRTPRPPKASGSGDRRASHALGEWKAFMNEMPPGTLPRPYTTSASYACEDYIEHPAFGVGRVIDILGLEKVQVIFRDGRKVLVCNQHQRQRAAGG